MRQGKEKFARMFITDWLPEGSKPAGIGAAPEMTPEEVPNALGGMRRNS